MRHPGSPDKDHWDGVSLTLFLDRTELHADTARADNTR